MALTLDLDYWEYGVKLKGTDVRIDRLTLKV